LNQKLSELHLHLPPVQLMGDVKNIEHLRAMRAYS